MLYKNGNVIIDKLGNMYIDKGVNEKQFYSAVVKH